MGSVRLGLMLLLCLTVPAVGLKQAWAEETGPGLKLETLAPGSVVSVLGQPVFDSNGNEIGMLVDVLVSQNGRPKAVVIDVGGFMGVGTRRVAVAWNLLRFSDKDGDIRIIEGLTQDETAAAPEYRGPEYRDVGGADIVVGRRKAPP